MNFDKIWQDMQNFSSLVIFLLFMHFAEEERY